jgi:uncharacterized membrane protein YphA (DoxX/SURF4 family)
MRFAGTDSGTFDGLVSGSTILALLSMGWKPHAGRIAFEIVLWSLSLLLISVFVRAGWAKFDDSSGWAQAFRVWGYPVWFRVMVGAVELTAAVLLVWSRTAAYGAALIIVTMLGGMGTHVFIEHRPARATSELGQLMLSSIVLAGRWQRRLTL